MPLKVMSFEMSWVVSLVTSGKRFISRLRKYLSPDHGLALRTLRGMGFVLEEVR